jgi:pyridoxine 4-dehydrogenase
MHMADSTLASQAGDVAFGDIVVHRLGLGTNRITDIPEAHALLTRAIELGVNFIDTARRYGMGASETTIGNTLAPYQNHKGLLIATKGGLTADGPAGSPEALRSNLEESLRALKTDHIDLYQLHRIDPNVPLEESVGTLKELQQAGKIRYIGLSEVSIKQLQAAQKVAEIVSVQNEYNVLKRQHEDLVTYCTEQHIVFIPWFPLGGLAGGAEEVAARLQQLAEKYQTTPQQLALAWLLKRSPIMAPIPGTLSPDHLEANLQAATITLSDEDYEQLTADN